MERQSFREFVHEQIEEASIQLADNFLMKTNEAKNIAVEEIDQAKKVENQRKMEMSLYSIVIFLSFFVFLSVLLIIDKTIFAAIFDLQSQLEGQAIGQVLQHGSSFLFRWTLTRYICAQCRRLPIAFALFLPDQVHHLIEPNLPEHKCQ